MWINKVYSTINIFLNLAHFKSEKVLMPLASQYLLLVLYNVQA